MGFGGLCDTSPFQGWVVGARAADGAMTSSWATPTAPGLRGAGIWMSGGGLMSDGPGRVFLATGNGFNAPGFTANQHTPTVRAPGHRPPSGLGSSIVHLTVRASRSLVATDFFTPCNAVLLDGSANNDRDVSSGGIVGLPPSFGGPGRRHLLVAGGKSGVLYLLDATTSAVFSRRCRIGPAPRVPTPPRGRSAPTTSSGVRRRSGRVTEAG